MSADRGRCRLHVAGRVQGVGFRPFARRLADELGLSGFVCNQGAGALVEIEGAPEPLRVFGERLVRELPPPGAVQAVTSEAVAPCDSLGFEIRASRAAAGAGAPPPDLAPCGECRAELHDPAARRFGYPFIACSRCGPRLSMVRGLPYDRARTAMGGFSLCPDCQREYQDPTDRRCHAQPLACPACGPQLALVDAAGRRAAAGEAALTAAIALLRSGGILALKGVGGFQLLANAAAAGDVARLRARKQRPHKPFAVMFPDLGALARACRSSAAERALVTAPQAPIVLLERRSEAAIAAGVAPASPLLGAFLPSSGLHERLLAGFGAALVVTSGNRSGEPLCTDDAEALARLSGIADAWLLHDRAVERPVEDSVVRWACGAPLLLRAARGYAPVALELPAGAPLLALGGHLKSTLAVAGGAHAWVGAPLGDLSSAVADTLFRRAMDEVPTLYGVTPQALVCDAHPDYGSSRHAERLARARGLPLLRVQHHQAHLAACIAEHGAEGPVLGLCWDGSGLGSDGGLWGGELIACDAGRRMRRVGYLQPFRLPGGEAAAREPRRAALGLLQALYGAAALSQAPATLLEHFDAQERRLLPALLERGTASPLTSSAGRLFDGVAALLGWHPRTSFEAQAALALELAAAPVEQGYDFALGRDAAGLWRLDWRPALRQLLAALAAGTPRAQIAGAFHATLAALAAAAARQLAADTVALCGGCFQNARLLAGCVDRLRADGRRVLWPQRLAPNDAGLSFGQAALARWQGFPACV